MNKTQKRSIQGAIGIGLLKAAINTASQLDQMKDNPQQKFDWSELLIETGKGVLIGGTGGAIIGSIEDYYNDLEKPRDTNAFLYSVAGKLRLRKDDYTFLRLQEKADVIINLITKEYSDLLTCVPFRIGSTEKGTALRNNCDIDIALSFKKNSFRSTAEMFRDLGQFLERKVGKYSIVSVREQHVSIGIFVTLYGKQYKMDVVPKKRSSTGTRDKSGYLYVNDNSFWRDNSSYTKTDFHALKSIRLTEGQKKIVIILKHWKNKNALPLSSHLLESLVLDAYAVNRYRIPHSLTGKIIMVLRHIAQNLDVAVIRSIENTNNILTDIFPESKSKIIDACLTAVDDYEYQPNSILDTFSN